MRFDGMRAQALALLFLIAAPAATFGFMVNRDVSLARLEGIDARCLVCNRKATRTLKSAAEGLRTRGLYVYDRSEYPGGMPVWCDRHGPDKLRENSRSAYAAALAAFAVAGILSKGIRRAA